MVLAKFLPVMLVGQNIRYLQYVVKNLPISLIQSPPPLFGNHVSHGNQIYRCFFHSLRNFPSVALASSIDPVTHIALYKG